MKKLDLDTFLDSKKSIQSSRYKEVKKVLEKHSNEQVIVFNSFKTCQGLLKVNFEEEYPERPLFVLRSKDSIKTRSKILQNFKEAQNGVLFLTFKIGAQGLNLQFCKNVVLCDNWWNHGTTE